MALDQVPQYYNSEGDPITNPDAISGSLPWRERIAKEWDALPGTPLQKFEQLATTQGGVFELANWAVETGRISSQEVASSGVAMAANQARQAQGNTFGAQLGEKVIPAAILGAMGYGAYTAAAPALAGEAAPSAAGSGLDFGGAGVGFEAAPSAGAGGTAGASPGFVVDPATGDTVLTTTGSNTVGSTAAKVGAAGGAANAAGQMVDGSTSGSNVDPNTGSSPGNAAGNGTALSRIIDGAGTTADYLSLAGNLGAAGLGYLGADRASDRMDALAREYMGLGAPSRARFEASFAPDFKVTDLPGVQSSIDTASESLLRKLSAQGGNPWGNPGGLTEAQNYIVGNIALPTINEYRRLNAGAGGLAALTGAAPGASMGAINAEGGKFDAVGGALANLTQPKRSYWDMFTEKGLA